MSQPPTPLSAKLLVRKEDVPASVKPPSAKPTGRMMISYRPGTDLYERLRILSFNQRRTMQSLLDEGVEMLLEAHKG